MSLVKTILEGNKIEYDDNEFEVLKDIFGAYLHYIGNGENVINPKGNTSCYKMFQYYEGANLNLTKFDTHNITDMNFMFNYCKNIKHLNLSNFNTSNVKSMNGMFLNCKKLKSLNLENFNTKNVVQLENMFRFCTNLKELDISSFHISKAKRIEGIFWNCKNLEKVKVSSNVSQFFANHKNYLFKNCNELTIIPITEFDKAIENLFY